MKLQTLFILIIFAFLLVSCSRTTQNNEIVARCIELCRSYPDSLENGPCLSNNIAPDWVCDVAHSPRQAVDNLPENQCSAFREGKAHHFIEVDENCELIKIY